MKVGIKYCGGCNPRYDRAAFVERLLSDHPEWDAVLLLQSSEQEAAFHRIASHLNITKKSAFTAFLALKALFVFYFRKSVYILLTFDLMHRLMPQPLQELPLLLLAQELLQVFS